MSFKGSKLFWKKHVWNILHLAYKLLLIFKTDSILLRDSAFLNFLTNAYIFCVSKVKKLIMANFIMYRLFLFFLTNHRWFWHIFLKESHTKYVVCCLFVGVKADCVTRDLDLHTQNTCGWPKFWSSPVHAKCLKSSIVKN